MVPIDEHPIHCWVETSKGNVIYAIHFAAEWATCRGGRHVESDGMFLGVDCFRAASLYFFPDDLWVIPDEFADFLVGKLRGWVVSFQIYSGAWDLGYAV
eukprot:465702-Pelagomonas_calceolata.AAC.2